MFLYINFAIRERDIRGYIAMLMDMPSLAALQLLHHQPVFDVRHPGAAVALERGGEGHEPLKYGWLRR